MKRQYLVAGHLFGLTMDDDSPFWNELANYEPFRADEGPDSEIFNVSVVGDLVAEEKIPLIVDKSEPGMPRLDLYSEGEGYWIEMAPLTKSPVCGCLRLSAGCNRAELTFSDAGKFCIDNALMLTFAFRTACLKTLEMHSSVVSFAGRAYMFLGKSGAGKSTHSRMWLENIPGCELMNDDNPIVRILDDGEVRVYGSPWSGKTPCYKNVSAPVGGLASIVQAPDNKIRKMGPVEAYVILSASVSGFRADRKMSDGLFETMEQMIGAVGFYELECRPDAGAAMLCNDTISR